MLHFHLLNLYFNFYLSTKYKLCFILVYRNCFWCQTIKITFPIFLLGFSLAHLSKLTHYIYRSTSQAIISVLSELITPDVLHLVAARLCRRMRSPAIRLWRQAPIAHDQRRRRQRVGRRTLCKADQWAPRVNECERRGRR